MNTINNSKHRRILTVTLGMVLSVLGCAKEEEAPKEVVRPAKVMTIAAGDAGWKRDFPAEIQAAQRVDLSFNVSGTLKKLNVKEGQEVKAGALIAKLDDRDLTNNLAAVRAKLDAAESQYNRYKELFAQNVATKSELEFRERQYKVEQAQIKIAEKAVADTQLKAPFSGRITKRHVENFQEVAAKQAVVSLQNLTSLEVVVNVPESIIAPVKKRGKLKAYVAIPSLPDRRFELTLKELAAQADPQTRTYRVALSMPPVEGANILPGMTATVTAEAVAAADEQGITVPVAAVGTNPDGTRFVWKVDGSMAVSKAAVKVGGLKADSITINEGLGQNDRIVTAGINDLSEGQKIREIAPRGDADK